MPAELAAYAISGNDAGLRDALIAADLPVEDLDEPGRRFLCFQHAGETVGYGGYEPHGPYVLLRSIVVAPSSRGQGLGRAIAEALAAAAKRDGAATAFLFTTTTGPFFEHLGFGVIDRASAPAEILATRQATTICSTATLLGRSLNDA